MASKKFNLEELKAMRLMWPDIPLEAIPEEKREKFNSRKMAVDMYIDEYSVAEIQKRTGIVHTFLPRLIERCTSLNASGNPCGYNALIPDLKTLHSDHRTPSGKFEKLLQKYPSLAEYIEKCWCVTT